MQKEFLLKLKEKFKKTLLRKNQEKKESQPRRNLSPNLLSPIETKDLFVKAAPTVVKTTNYVVILVSAVFMLLLFFNFILDRQLTTLSRDRDNLIMQIETASQTERKVKEISNQIDLYKNKKAERVPIAEGLDFVVTNITRYVKLESLAYEGKENRYEVDARATTPTSFAFMINGLLSKDYVESIVIRTVQLVRGERDYLAHFEVYIK